VSSKGSSASDEEEEEDIDTYQIKGEDMIVSFSLYVLIDRNSSILKAA